MTVILTANRPYGRDNSAPPPALRLDGTNFPWRMFFEDNSRIADADTPAEMLDLLKPGYLDAGDETEKLELRTELARSVQALARAVSLANISKENLEKMKEWEWNVLNFGGGDSGAPMDPYGWGDGTGELGVANPDVVDFWSSDVPLILVETSYQPYTDIHRPISHLGDYYKSLPNMIWLRPQDELTLLRSLSQIGYITFGTPSDPVDD